MTEASLQAILGKNGSLIQSLKGAKFRAPQLQMAQAIAKAIEENANLIVEAATGTGKTFAYLVPAILSGKKILLSTGTKNLQDQLFTKDIPALANILKRPLKVALLKGRSNYLCKHRIELNGGNTKFYSRQTVSEIYKINLWQTQNREGDKAKIDFIPENSEVWPLVTSTKDNCLGQDCEFFKKCFLVKARKTAHQADIVVINHHLFFADLLVKEEGFGELLPETDVIIFDEAHHLADIATIFLGKSLSSRRIIELAKDSAAEVLKHVPAGRDILDITQTLHKAIDDMRLSFGMELVKKPWRQICFKKTLSLAVEGVHAAIDDLIEQLKLFIQVEKGIEACFLRAVEIKALLEKITHHDDSQYIHWYETYPKSFILHQTPLDITEDMQKVFVKEKSWIFTSATLTVKNTFDFFIHQMGLKNSNTLQLHSHYDYSTQAEIFLPDNLPEPNHPEYVSKMIQAVLPVINAYHGKTFFLFTSFSALYQAAQILRNSVKYPLLIQGEKPKSALIQAFIHHGNAILLGTQSFWEGVDVKGEALSCVIIDKLPFAAPNDPVMQARIQAMRKAGQDPFNDYQLPQAVITLKQGVGRLIRDEKDKGTIILCDPRIKSKGYGQVFLDSLPKMSILKTPKHNF